MWADDNLLKKMFGSYSKLYLHLKFFYTCHLNIPQLA